MSVIHSIKSAFHNIRITEEGSIRKMVFRGGMCSDQSAIDLKFPDSHVFDFTLLAMGSLQLSPNPSKILIVGLGGGIIPMKMAKELPNAKIDIIELDPEVVRLAKKYFFFKEIGNIKVYIGDAFQVAKEMTCLYDIAIIDAYFSGYIPFHIMSKEFFKTIHNITSEDGLIAVNMANVHPSFYSQVNTIRHIFGDNLYHMRGQRNPNITMLFASKKNIGSSLTFKITTDIMNAKIISMDDMQSV